MDKEHFLIELKLHLRQLSLTDQQGILKQYEQLFSDKMSEGFTEYEITKELGSPKAIAISVLKKFNLELKEHKSPYSDWAEFSTNNPDFEEGFPYSDDSIHSQQENEPLALRFFQVTGIICLNLFFMLWVIVSWISLLVAGWATSLVLIFSPILGIFSFVNYGGTYGLFQLSITILLFGFGLIGILIAVPLSKISFKLIKKYGHWNITVLKGEHA